MLSLLVFLLAASAAFLFEDLFRRMIRYFYQYSTNDNLSFVGKDFHLFASGIFLIAFGMFCLFVFNVVNRNNPFHTFIVTGFFFLAAFSISYLDSKLRIISCTACSDGKLKLNYNAVDYDLIFIASLTISILPFLPKFIRGFGAKK